MKAISTEDVQESLVGSVWELELPSTRKMMLLCLAMHVDSDCRCRKSLAELARLMGVCERSVRRCLADLEASSLISRAGTSTAVLVGIGQKVKTKTQSPTQSQSFRLRGTRLPKGWEPSDAVLEWAKACRPDLDLKNTVESFRDYWTSTAGGKGVKLDWAATFRNWVRNEKRERVNGGAGGSPWHLTEAGTLEHGRKLGLNPRPGEDWQTFKARLFAVRAA